jgi:site-specific DNA-methyltransferase (adenine-specific)
MENISEIIDKITVGDCIKELKNIPDRSIDLIILDPPYWKVVNEECELVQ